MAPNELLGVVMSLPCDIEELRETLNAYVELEEENSELRRRAIEDAQIISSLRRKVSDLLGELQRR